MAGSGAGERGADLRRLARDSSLNLGGSFVAAALNLVLPVVVTRGLATADAGLFFQATALFAILLNLGTLGADTGVLRSIPRARVQDRPGDATRYLVIALVPSVLFACLLGLGLVLVAEPLAGLLSEGEQQREAMRQALRVLAPMLPVAVAYAVVMSTSRGLDSILPLVLGEKIGRTALETGGAALVATLTSSLVLIVLAWVAPYAAMLVVIGVWVVRRLAVVAAAAAETAATTRPWRQLAGEFWRFSAPRAASRVFTVALQRFDVLVVGALRGPEDAALYAAATRFVVLGLMFVQAIQQVMTPRISEMLALEEHRRARDALPDHDGLADPGLLAGLPDRDALLDVAARHLRPRLRPRLAGRGDPLLGDAGRHLLRARRLGAAHGRAQHAQPDEHRPRADGQRLARPRAGADVRRPGRRRGLGGGDPGQQPAAAVAGASPPRDAPLRLPGRWPR